MADRNYGTGIRAALWSLSQSVCYWPTPQCAEPTVRIVAKTPVCNLEIAHIRAVSLGGPRYDENMEDEERNSFENLILLCHPHHTIIDGPKWRDFPVTLLKEWKTAHEKAGRAELSKLTGITEKRFQEIIVDAFESSTKRVEGALAKFEQMDLEAAKLLRSMLDQLTSLRLNVLLDEGIISQLAHAADILRYSMNEGVVVQLASAANGLKSSLSEDIVNELARAADSLSHLEDTVYLLSNAARDLRRYQDM